MKTIFILNGKGACGKDTLVDSLDYPWIQKLSSIDPVKEIAQEVGWEGTKDERSRKFLSDLKALFSEYNDFPNRNLLERIQKSFSLGSKAVFVMIREPEEIQKFTRMAQDHIKGVQVFTILVKADSRTQDHYGNRSDDQVEDFQYDMIFYNDDPLEETIPRFRDMIISLTK